MPTIKRGGLKCLEVREGAGEEIFNDGQAEHMSHRDNRRGKIVCIARMSRTNDLSIFSESIARMHRHETIAHAGP